jgi:hypothetical protein
MHTSGNNRKRKISHRINKVKSIKKKIMHLPSCISPFAQKDNYHDIYHINYNKIAGLETYPGKFNIIINDQKNFAQIKKKAFMPINLTYYDNRKNNMGYMTSQEILNEITSLSNKHKISDEGGEELLKIGKDVNEIALHTRNKLREPGIPINLGSLLFYYD